jgi:hypothetical protein
VTVTTQAGCSWIASSNNTGVVTITSGANGTGSGTVTYTVAANGAVDQRLATLSIAGRTFTIIQSGTGPAMSLDRSSLNFGAVSTGSSFSAKTGIQAVRLRQTGAGTVTWTASSNQPWLTVSPASGTGPAILSVSVAFAGGVPTSGTLTGLISIAFSGAGSAPSPFSVNLTTKPQGTSSAPSGVLDTPLNGSTGITGSIAVTGWALDDVEVSRVRIVRDPVGGEAPGYVPIGDAVFVDGSRTELPDKYPGTPRNLRGGWGYLLLTNFLPNQGNGTFRLHAIADDAEGKSTLLDGSKTITVSNQTATLPFGAIDTPEQGATITGTSYNNFGWVLGSGGHRADPPGGGAVQVFIDGAPVGAPGGWGPRSDISTLFPGHAGVNTAAGVFTFNPSLYTDGGHSIAWLVTDQADFADGIGSRYFTIASGAVSGAITEEAQAGTSLVMTGPELMLPVRTSSRAAASARLSLADEIAAAPVDARSITGRRGFNLETPMRPLDAVMYGEELDRFELRLAGTTGHQYTGYLRAGDQLAPLPIGSRLVPSTGEFTWQPGVGFVGTYDFVFVRWDSGRALSRQEVRIVLHPKGSNRVGPQVMIDTPSAELVADGPFVVAGWAIDLDADIGTGVDTLHVWAYPLGGADPIFVGATEYGGDRPDVGAIFGDRFRQSGYGLVVDGLQAGRYDLAVFAWSTAANRFVPAKVVRVTVR